MELKIIPFLSSISPMGLKEELLKEFSSTRVRVVEPETYQQESGTDRVILFIGTGGTENDVADFLSQHSLRPPITLLSYDLRNSLPAAMEIRSYLQQNGINSRIVYSSFSALHQTVTEWSEFAEVLTKVSRSSIGIIGKPSSWLIASKINKDQVTARWGITTRQFSLASLIESTRSTSDAPLSDPFKQSATSCSPTDDDIRKARLVAESLRELVQKEALDAVTVECFSLLMETGVSGCFALSLLNDLQESTAGCEGDIPATFTMMLGRMLTGQIGFMANVTQVDNADNTAVFAHCTLPTSLAESYEITSHFETGLSIGIRGTLKKQPVTIFKVFGDDLREYWVSNGEIVENLVNDTGCRTQIRVRLEEDVNYFLERSLANHHIVFPGVHAEKIRKFFSFTEG
jgi:L-fucose isomerase-like protein